eukprot:1153391-Pelagomonas_calceolata.AAC.17
MGGAAGPALQCKAVRCAGAICAAATGFALANADAGPGCDVLRAIPSDRRAGVCCAAPLNRGACVCVCVRGGEGLTLLTGRLLAWVWLFWNCPTCCCDAATLDALAKTPRWGHEKGHMHRNIGTASTKALMALALMALML